MTSPGYRLTCAAIFLPLLPLIGWACAAGSTYGSDEAVTAPPAATTNAPSNSGDDASAPSSPSTPPPSGSAPTPPNETEDDASMSPDDATSPVSPVEDSATAPSVDASTGAIDAGSSSSSTCGSYLGPTLDAGCNACDPTDTCQANGCYNGYWCDTSDEKCKEKPSTC